jgi:hypothetical protein
MTLDSSMIEQQNETLIHNIKEVKDKYSTDDQKSYYINEKIKKMDFTVNSFLFVYVIVSLICIYIIFTSKTFSTSTKIFLVLVIIIYPFVGSILVSAFYNTLKYFYVMIQGKPFEK